MWLNFSNWIIFFFGIKNIFLRIGETNETPLWENCENFYEELSFYKIYSHAIL